MSYLQFGNTAFASVRVESVTANRGVGDHAVLLVTVRAQNNAPNATNVPRAVRFAGEVRTRNGEHIGEVRAGAFRWWANRAESEALYMRAPVTFSTLSALNGSRRSAGEDVELELALTVEYEDAQAFEQHPLNVQFRIASSDWLRLLSAARHTTFAVVELPLDGEPVPPGLAASMRHYSDAKAHLQQCQWDDAIADCRQVLDELQTAIGATEPQPPLAAYGTAQQRAWDFAERCAAVRAIIRHTTHTAHHGQRNFSAEEARYVVEMTGVILKFYSARLRQ